MADIRYTVLSSPVGELLLTASDDGLTGLQFSPHLTGPDDRGQRDDAAFSAVVGQLEEYFAGRRTTFDLRLCPIGTPFQRRVWDAIADIPYGRTVSYGTVASRIKQPTAARAVGMATGRNPIAIIVPCHRVVGADGSLTGFGGGLDRKTILLELEARTRAGASND
jgi:methylated-DNA-[protein]-cysteine S-methyltransferase